MGIISRKNAEIDRIRDERDKWMGYATGDRAELALKMEALRVELAEVTKERDYSRQGNAKVLAELAAKDARIKELEEKYHASKETDTPT